MHREGERKWKKSSGKEEKGEEGDLFLKFEAESRGGGREKDPSFLPPSFLFLQFRLRGTKEGSKIGAFRIFSGSENREEEEQWF